MQIYYWTNQLNVFDNNQGTAGVALGGLLGAVRAMGRPIEDLVKCKIVVVGAGRYFDLQRILAFAISLSISAVSFK